MPQSILPLFPKHSVEINEYVAVVRDEETLTYFYGPLPIFRHSVDDQTSFKMITSQLHVNGSVTQKEIYTAFGVTPVSVKRSVKLFREKGNAGFFEKRRGRGASVLTASVIKEAQRLFHEGLDVATVASKLGVKGNTLNKAVLDGRLTKKKAGVPSLPNLPPVPAATGT